MQPWHIGWCVGSTLEGLLTSAGPEVRVWKVLHSSMPASVEAPAPFNQCITAWPAPAEAPFIHCAASLQALYNELPSKDEAVEELRQHG